MRLIRIVFLAILAFLLQTNTARPGTIDPNTPDSKYVEFGKSFPSVVRIKTRAKCKKPECKVREHDQYGSAVIIRPHWILTAAHVVLDTTDTEIILSDDTRKRLSRVIPHQEFQEDKFGHFDVALGYSPDELKLEFYTPIYADTDEVGQAVTISGFGMHGTFNTGIVASDSQKRAGHNKIDYTDRGFLICTPSTGHSRLPLEFMIGPGDSGGGLFIGNKLAGISSCILAADKKPDGTYGDESAFTRMSLYTDWVESQIRSHELALLARATQDPELR